MTDDFASKLTQKISAQAIKPRSRLRFLATRSAYWTLSMLSGLIGAVAVATLIYYFTDKSRTGGAGFDEMPIDDFFEIVPYFWLVFLGLASASTTLAFRATPRGYLWRPRNVFGLTLVASILGGIFLYTTGFGPFLNREFADLVPGYARIIAVEDWRNTSPDSGRLVGKSLGLDPAGQLILRDFRGSEWTVSVHDATLSLDAPLGSDEDLDISGTRIGPDKFSARTITDWR